MGAISAGWGNRRPALLELFLQGFELLYADNGLCTIWARFASMRAQQAGQGVHRTPGLRPPHWPWTHHSRPTTAVTTITFRNFGCGRSDGACSHESPSNLLFAFLRRGRCEGSAQSPRSVRAPQVEAHAPGYCDRGDRRRRVQRDPNSFAPSIQGRNTVPPSPPQLARLPARRLGARTARGLRQRTGSDSNDRAHFRRRIVCGVMPLSQIPQTMRSFRGQSIS